MLKVPEISLPTEKVSWEQQPIDDTPPTGVWGKLVKAAATPFRFVPKVAKHTAEMWGHLSAGDVQSLAKVPGIFDDARAAYKQASPSLMNEMLSGLKGSSVMAAGSYHTALSLIGAAGQSTAGNKAEAKRLIQNLGAPVEKNQGVFELAKEQLEYVMPEYGKGMSYVIYRDGKQVKTAKVPTYQVASFTQRLQSEGKNVLDFAKAEGSIQSEMAQGLTSKMGITPNDAIAFGAEMADPMMALMFGKIANVTVKGIAGGAKLAAKVPGVTKGIKAVAEFAGRNTGPTSSMGKLIERIETSPVLGVSLRSATKSVRDKMYPYTLTSRALRTGMSEQIETAVGIMRGEASEARVIAKMYMEAKNPILKAQSARWLVGHGLVSGETLEDSAKSILRLTDPSIDKATRLELEKLSYSMASGEAANAEILARVDKAIKNGLPVPEESALIRQNQQIFREMGERAVELGIDPRDLKTMSNALRLPRGGLGIIDERVIAKIDDFGDLLTTGKYKAAYTPEPEELQALLANAPELSTFAPEVQKRLAAGMKIIGDLEAGGISTQAAYQMKSALKASLNLRYDANVTELVSNLVKADRVISREAALGPYVKTKKAEEVLRVRKAVEELAKEKGLDIDTINTMAKMARNVDDGIGRLEADLGIISREQFDSMQGWHIRRSYNWDAVEEKIQQLYKTDPERAARLEHHYVALKESEKTLKNVGYDIGGIETGIAKRRKPLDPELREFLEQFNNLTDALLVSGKKAANTISSAMLYDGLRFSGIASESFLPGYRKIPGTLNKVATTTTKSGKGKTTTGHSWGALSGMYVPDTVYADLVRHAKELHTSPDELMSLWVKHVVRPLKLGNVVYNYVARAHNTVSNFMAMQLGTGVTNSFKLMGFGKSAMIDLMERGEAFQRFSRYSPSLREASIMLHEQFSNLMATESKGLFEKTLIGKASKGIQKSMSWEEGMGKLTIFKIATTDVAKGGLGMTDQQAVLLAEKFMIDYGNVPPIVDVLRRKFGLFPFMTYGYKMAGNLLRAPIEKPEVIAKQWKFIDAMQNLVDPEVVETEKGGLPEYLKDKIVFRLPGKDARYINIEPFIPYNIFSPEGMASLSPANKIILGNLGQPFKGFMELATNRNLLTGADIVPKGSDPVTAATIRGEYVTKQLAPLRQTMNLFDAISGTPQTPTAKPRTAWEVIMVINNFDIDRNAELNYKIKMKQYSDTVKLAGKTLQMENLDEREKQRRFENLMQYADQLRIEGVKQGDNLVKIRGLDEYLLQSGARPEDLPQLLSLYQERGAVVPEDKRMMQEAVDAGYDTVQKINAAYEEASAQLAATLPTPMALPPTTDYRKMQPQTELMMEADQILQSQPNPALPQHTGELPVSVP